MSDADPSTSTGPNETRYYDLDADAGGGPLNASRNYAVTFAKGQLPPVKGFWSLTLYNEHHFFAPNAINRYSLGTKNRDLATNADGSLTIHIAADPPAETTNWLPAPKGADFVLYMRAYWPEDAIANGQWTPPAVTAPRAVLLGRQRGARRGSRTLTCLTHARMLPACLGWSRSATCLTPFTGN